MVGGPPSWPIGLADEVRRLTELYGLEEVVLHPGWPARMALRVARDGRVSAKLVEFRRADRGHPHVSVSTWRRPPDLDLLRQGRLARGDLHPLVHASLFPGLAPPVAGAGRRGPSRRPSPSGSVPGGLAPGPGDRRTASVLPGTRHRGRGTGTDAAGARRRQHRMLRGEAGLAYGDRPAAQGAAAPAPRSARPHLPRRHRIRGGDCSTRATSTRGCATGAGGRCCTCCATSTPSRCCRALLAAGLPIDVRDAVRSHTAARGGAATTGHRRWSGPCSRRARTPPRPTNGRKHPA